MAASWRCAAVLAVTTRVFSIADLMVSLSFFGADIAAVPTSTAVADAPLPSKLLTPITNRRWRSALRLAHVSVVQRIVMPRFLHFHS